MLNTLLRCCQAWRDCSCTTTVSVAEPGAAFFSDAAPACRREESHSRLSGLVVRLSTLRPQPLGDRRWNTRGRKSIKRSCFFPLLTSICLSYHLKPWRFRIPVIYTRILNDIYFSRGENSWSPMYKRPLYPADIRLISGYWIRSKYGCFQRFFKFFTLWPLSADFWLIFTHVK